jgi:hypothetical protein
MPRFQTGLTAVILTAAALHPYRFAEAQLLTLPQLLDSNAVAMGGRERLDTLQSVVTLRTRSSLTSLKLPHFVLVEGFDSTGSVNYAEGYNGRQAWEQTRRDSSRRVVTGRPEIALRRVVQWPGNVLPLYRLAEFGHSLHLEGTDTIDGVVHYRIRLTLTDGFQRWYFIDSETYRIARARDTRELHANDGNIRDIETVFADYRAVGGYWFPFTVFERDLRTGERLFGRTMLAIFPNADVPDSLFDATTTSDFNRVRHFRALAKQ